MQFIYSTYPVYMYVSVCQWMDMAVYCRLHGANNSFLHPAC